MDNSAPTARFLQARITHTTTTLITRLENILAIALPSSQPSTTTTNTDSAATVDSANAAAAPSHAKTAVESFNLGVETTALVKAAQDLMGLGRGMKELWLSDCSNSSSSSSSGSRVGSAEARGAGEVVQGAAEDVEMEMELERGERHAGTREAKGDIGGEKRGRMEEQRGARPEDVRAVVEGLGVLLANRAEIG